MKKIKYISFSLIALLIGILCISFIPMNKTYAKDYTYEAQLIEDNTFLPDYAITDIEYAKVNGDICCNITKSGTGFNDLIWFTSSDVPSFSVKQFIIEFNFTNNEFYKNYFGKYFSIYMSSSTGFSFYHHGNNLRTICDWNTNDDFILKFKNSNFSIFGRNEYITDNFYSFCDFDSNSDTTFNIYSLTNSFWGMMYYYSIGEFNYQRFDFELFDYVTSFCAIGDTDMYYFDLIDRFRFFSLPLYNLRSFLVFDYYFDFYELNVGLYRPSYRINNTLVIYNFDYYNGLYSNITYLNYVLRRGNDYYNITYGSTDLSPSDNPLPNSNYVCFYNKDVQNIIFDEFITITAKTRKRINYFIDNNVLCVSAGFDFNFVQYSQPLVASNGSFNFTFDKPKYVDMKFSLAPFYIPILEMVENAFIFLMFYCPIISDILELIHLDLFMGGIINVINFIVGGAVGQFILSCIAFIIFFELLRRFMPVVYSAGVNIYHNSNVYKYRQEKKQAKKEWKYQKYKNKQFAKNEIKARKKMEKSYIKQAKSNSKISKRNIK